MFESADYPVLIIGLPFMVAVLYYVYRWWCQRCHDKHQGDGTWSCSKQGGNWVCTKERNDNAK